MRRWKDGKEGTGEDGNDERKRGRNGGEQREGKDSIEREY